MACDSRPGLSSASSVSLARRNLADLRTLRGGRDEPKSSRDRLPDRGPCQRQGATRRAARVDARSRESAGQPRYRAFLPFHGPRERRSFSSSRTSTARSTSISSGSWRRAGPVFDAIFDHVDDPPATPVAGDPQRVIKWLKHHVREPLDTYFAYEDASVQDIKAAASAAGFTGNTSQAALLTYMSIKSRLQGFALKLAARSIREKGHEDVGFRWDAACRPFRAL